MVRFFMIIFYGAISYIVLVVAGHPRTPTYIRFHTAHYSLQFK